jgi:tetratricopeptide (TPR) repeat protein
MLGDKELKRRYLIIYRKAMEEALLDDPDVDVEKSSMLKSLRKNLHITREEHKKINKRVRLRLEVTSIDEEDYTGRLDYYNKLLSKNKKNEDAWVGKGEALYNLAQYQRAVKCLEKALEIDANFEEAWYFRGLSLTELEDIQEALDCFDKAITLYPEYKEAWLGSSLALNRGGESKKALACVNKALELDPKYLPSIVGQIFILLDLEDYETALETSDTGLSVFPKNEELVMLKREAQKCLGVAEEDLEPMDFDYSLPEESEGAVKELVPEEGVEMSELMNGEVMSDEVITEEVVSDHVFDEDENIPVLEMVAEEDQEEEPLQELEVLPEEAIYEPELQEASEVMEAEPVDDVLPSTIPEVAPMEEEEEPASKKGESEDDLGPSAGPVGKGKKGKRSRKKIEKKKDDMGPIGPEAEEEDTEELMELQPLEPIIEEDSEMEFEEAEELVEEIIEQMESGTEEAEDLEEALEEGEEVAEAEEVKEALDIEDTGVEIDEESFEDMEESTKFESTFDSYEFSAEMEDVLVECKSCGDLIPDDVAICPICDAHIGGGPPPLEVEEEDLVPEPEPEPVKPKLVKKERPSLLQLRKARKKKGKPKRFRARRLFAGIQKIHKLIKCPECGGPVAVPTEIRPLVVSCSQCGSYGKLV